METFSALLAICAGNSPVNGEFPTQRPVTRSFDVFFDLRLNKQLNKQSWGWWLETLCRPLWRHCNPKNNAFGDLATKAQPGLRGPLLTTRVRYAYPPNGFRNTKIVINSRSDKKDQSEIAYLVHSVSMWRPFCTSQWMTSELRWWLSASLSPGFLP